jgi:hypothetical protein
MPKFVPPLILVLLLAGSLRAPATQEVGPVPDTPFHQTPEVPNLDSTPPPTVPGLGAQALVGPKAAGPIAPAGTQPVGALSGRIVFTSAGHGWDWTGSAWALGRDVLNAMSEDYGNIDQMTMFAFYCFNAGATVVPFRPIGFQTNEVVLDNVSLAVTWSGTWDDSTSTTYFGAPGAVPYRYASLSAIETATATYTPNIPMAGFYPVYTWVLSGGNRTNQLYRINHTGGQSLVRVPHHMVGNGWVYLGAYSFNAGSNAASGSVAISNLGEGAVGASVVIADAIRFGNGKGDVDRGGGISSYPREEEGSRYWVQCSLGQGQDSGIYANGNVSAPPRMAAEMNREASGNMFKRIYIGFHSNSSTDNTNTATARGDVGLYNDPSLSTNVAPNSNTPNQRRLAEIIGTNVNNALKAITVPPFEVGWTNNRSSLIYARSDYAFGEINNNYINNEFDATIIEVAFHDNVYDAALLRDPKFRNWSARASYQAVVRYMNQFDGVPLNFLPEPPVNVRALATNNSILVSWSAPVSEGNSGPATGYMVYRSTDGYGLGNPVGVTGVGTTSLAFTNLAADTDYYFRVAATNAGGESFPSATVGCRRAANALSTRILFVNGFTRFDRTLDLRQTPAPRQYKPPGHNANSGTMDRVLPRSVNAFDYVVAHGKAISAAGLMAFDSCQLQAVTNGTVSLTNYGILIWQCGNQSSADRTFNSAAQAKATAFLAAGGHLFVSGAEIAWDLDRASGPTTADRNFLHNQLHAWLINNTNDDSGIYTFTPATGSIFTGNATGAFDDGSQGIYWVGYPDAATPTGTGAAAALNYPGYSGGAAAVRYDGSAGGGKVIYFGFPFETITSASVRNPYLADILKYFSRPVRFELITWLTNNNPRLVLSGEPGLTYGIQRSSNFVNWVTLTNLVNTNGTFEFIDASATTGQRLYRAFLAF